MKVRCESKVYVDCDESGLSHWVVQCEQGIGHWFKHEAVCPVAAYVSLPVRWTDKQAVGNKDGES